MAAAYPEPGPVVWKDPRACLLLPYWRSVLPGPLTAVLVWREPLAVARSLQTRDGIPLADGLALWEHYNRSAATGLQGVDTYVLDYASRGRRPGASLAPLSTGWAGSTSSPCRRVGRRAAAATIDAGWATRRQARIRDAAACRTTTGGGRLAGRARPEPTPRSTVLHRASPVGPRPCWPPGGRQVGAEPTEVRLDESAGPRRSKPCAICWTVSEMRLEGWPVRRSWSGSAEPHQLEGHRAAAAPWPAALDQLRRRAARVSRPPRSRRIGRARVAGRSQPVRVRGRRRRPACSRLVGTLVPVDQPAGADEGGDGEMAAT